MPEFAFILLIIPVAAALLDWRKGLVLCVVVAICQDALRKLTPGQPVYFVVLTGVVFAASWLGAVMTRVRLGPSAIQDWRAYVGVPFSLFVLLVVAQAVHSYIRFGNPMIPVIGLLSYLAPIPAVVIAYQFAIRRGLVGVQKWMWFYTLAALLTLSGVYLEFAEFDWPVLGEVGQGLIITGFATPLKAYSGFFRSSEVAAWHGATTACFIFMLFIGKRFTVPRILISVGLIAFLLSVGILTGRRKMLVEVAVFLAAYVFLVAWFQKGTTRGAVFAATFGVLTYFAIVGLVSPDPGEVLAAKERREALTDRFDQYATRGESAFEDIPNRIAGLGIQPIIWAIDGNGWFGAGLGTGSQGVQHFTGRLNNGAAEGGLGKITLELGVPGLALVGWLVVAFARYIRRILEVTTKVSRSHARFAYGLVAFLLANAAAFALATQVYGDLFILLAMGWTVGFLLAMPVLAVRDTRPAAARAKLPQHRVVPSPSRPFNPATPYMLGEIDRK